MIDMQNDLGHEEGFYARIEDSMRSHQLVPSVVRELSGRLSTLLEGFRESGAFVVHTQMVRSLAHRIAKIHRVVPLTFELFGDREPPLVPDSWGAQTLALLAPRDGEYVLQKRGFSAFYQTDLETVLRRQGIATVVLAGAITHACVLHTAFDAHVRDLDVVMASDGTATWAEHLQGATLDTVDLVIGASANCDEIIDALRHSR